MSEPELIPFNILKDNHLIDEANDRFDYKSIAGSILDIINNVDPPFTIGLYGQWGLGKSSICSFVQERIKKEGKYRVFYFDTWKYQRDSFRRQFLIELDQDIFKGSLNYQTILTQSLTIPYSLPLWQNIKKTFRENTSRLIARGVTLVFYTIVFAGSVFLIDRYAYDFLNQSYADLLKLGTNTLFSLGALVVISKFIVESVKTDNAQTSTPRTDTAEGFDHYYQKALEKLDRDKLIVIIDNLDRVDHQSGVELLSDIKTFLANNKIRETKNKAVFLVPCDDAAISEILRGVYPHIDTEEFLRKFFNVSIRIPKLLDLSLDSYITSKLAEAQVPEFQRNASLSFVISRAFKNNPREVIQFINALTSNYLLVRRRKLSVLIEKENLPFFAKVLAIQMKWPSIYKYIEDRVIRLSDPFIDAVKTVKPAKHDAEYPAFKEFTDTTPDIKDQENGEEIYFSLFQSEHSEKLPEWPAFISAAEDLRQSDLEKIYLAIAESEDKKTALKDLLLSYFNRNESRREKLLNIFRSLHKILSDENIFVFEPFMDRAYSALPADSLLPHLEEINFKKLIGPKFSDLGRQTRNNVAKGTVEVIDLISRQSPLALERLERIFDFFETVADKPLRTSFQNLDSRLKTVKSSVLINLKIAELMPTEAPAWFLPKFLAFVSKYPPKDSQIYPTALYQLFFLSQYGLFQADKKDSDEILRAALEFLNENEKPARLSGDEQQKVSQFSSQMVTLYNASADWVETKNILARIFILMLYAENPQLEIVKSSLSDFIANQANSSENVLAVVGKQKLLNLMSEHEILKSAVINRTKNDPTLAITLRLKNDFFEDHLERVLSNLADSKYEGLIRFLNHIEFKLSDAYKIQLVSEMIERNTKVAVELLPEWLDTLKKLGVTDGQKNRLAETFREIKGKDGDFAEVVKKFLKKSKKIVPEELLKDLLDE